VRNGSIDRKKHEVGDIIVTADPTVPNLWRFGTLIFDQFLLLHYRVQAAVVLSRMNQYLNFYPIHIPFCDYFLEQD
jgi:hypothetical protein